MGYVLLDYKTGNVETIVNYLIELGIYIHIFEYLTKEKIAKVGIIGLKERKLYLRERKQSDIDAALMLFKKINYQIENDEFDFNPKANCYWCPKNYRKLCSRKDKGSYFYDR